MPGSECTNHDLYCVNASGDYVQFLELNIHATVYGAELREGVGYNIKKASKRGRRRVSNAVKKTVKEVGNSILFKFHSYILTIDY